MKPDTFKKVIPIEELILADWIELAKKGFISETECDFYFKEKLWDQKIYLIIKRNLVISNKGMNK